MYGKAVHVMEIGVDTEPSVRACAGCGVRHVHAGQGGNAAAQLAATQYGTVGICAQPAKKPPAEELQPSPEGASLSSVLSLATAL